jgi:uncharacterized protein with HEPN domain
MNIPNEDNMPLWDIVLYSREICTRLKGISLDEYKADRDLRLIIERLLIIIGEAAARVSTTFRDEHPEIPWRQIIGQRHVLAHGYDVVEDSLVYETCTVGLPELLRLMEPLVSGPPEE